MVRSLCTIAIVAALSAVLSGLERAQADRDGAGNWIRTADGWEHAEVLDRELQSSGPPVLHPLLVASFQLGASLFVLLAFPRAPQVKPAAGTLSRPPVRSGQRRAIVVGKN